MEKEYVVGALASEFTPPKELMEDECLVECCKCKEKVWIMSWNMDKLPICMPCIGRVAQTEECTFGITEQDLKTSGSYMRRRKGVK